MKETKWVVVFKTNKPIEAEIIKGNLEHAGLTCVLVNKQDRSYLAFGLVELHVPEQQEAEAVLLINQQTTGA